MPASELRTLGTFAFRIDGRAIARPSTQKARALLAYLALRRGVTIPRDEIVETFWPQSEPDNARQSLKTALWSIRRAIRDAGIDPIAIFAADHSTVRWHAPTAVDAGAFEERARAGDTGALSLYTGDFLPGDYDLWASAQRERLIQTLESLLARSLRERGDVGAAQWLLQLDPFSEEAYGSLIEAELAENRTLAAATLLARFRRVLRENGLEASAEFERRFQRLDGTPSQASAVRFAGRARELAAFDRYVRAGDASGVVVSGDAGLGKTALLDLFARQAAQAGRTVVSIAVPRDPGGFGGWDRIYQERTGKPFGELAVQSGSNLSSALAGAIVEHLPPGSFVFVDDAHHLQGDAAYVTEAIAARAQGAGISLIFGTRPEGIRQILALAATPHSIEMPLGGLTEQEIREVLPQRGGDAETLARALYERTQGHPLFLQRILERLEGGTLALDMPASVRALVERRLHERGEDAYAVASLLALDPQFGGDELAIILKWPQERVLDALDDLLGLGIVREAPEGAYLEFSHEIVREVARDSLGPQRRRHLHRLAAEMLEAAAAISDVARCAGHRAGGGQEHAAAKLYLRCSQAANAVFEPRNAAVFARRARTALLKLEATPEMERLVLEIDAAEIKALNAASDPNGAERVASAAIALAQKLGDPRSQFEMLALRMRARMRTSELDGIEADARSALEVAGILDDQSSFAEAYLGMLQIALCRMNEGDAMTYSGLALDAALASGDTDLAIFVASERLHALVIFWKFPEAMETLRHGEKLLKSGSGTTAANLRYAISQLMYSLGRYEEGLAHVDRALDSLEETRAATGKFVPDRQRIIAILTNMRGLICVARGAWEDAWTAAQAFAANPAAQIPGIHAHTVDLQVRALLGRNAPGDVERAAAVLATIDPNALFGDTKMYAASARARIAARRNAPDAAVLVADAIGIARETAQIAGLDVDSVFADLADAARECGAAESGALAEELRDRYRGMRRDAAGAHWGGDS